MVVVVRLASGVGPPAVGIFDYGGAGIDDVNRNGGVAGCSAFLGRLSREAGVRSVAIECSLRRSPWARG